MIKIIKNNDGATAVEFAIIAFPLFILMMGIFEFSLIYYANNVLENSTTIGARLGITGSDYAGEARVAGGADRTEVIKNNIVSNSSGLLDADEISITCQDLGADFNGIPEGARGDHSCGAAIKNNSSCSTAGAGGNVVLYTVSYCWPLFTPLAGLFNGWLGSTTTPDQILLSSSLLVRNEKFKDLSASP